MPVPRVTPQIELLEDEQVIHYTIRLDQSIRVTLGVIVDLNGIPRRDVHLAMRREDAQLLAEAILRLLDQYEDEG